MDNDKIPLKNVKIAEHVHKQIKKVSKETGINLGHLVEMGVLKVVEEYKSGAFDSVKSQVSKIRRDGTFARVS